MSECAWTGVLLLFLVSMLVRVLPALWPGLERLDLDRGVLAELPDVVLINLIAACVVLELQSNLPAAAAGFGAAGLLCLWRPNTNLLLQLLVATGAYGAVAFLQGP